MTHAAAAARPPSAGPYEFNEAQLEGIKSQGKDLEAIKAAKAEATGRYYRLMTDHVKKVLADIKRVYPDYNPDQGYELAGFVWFQGWNDMCTKPAVPEYEQNLVNLIHDVRKALKAPTLPVVVAETGNCNHMEFRKAQAAAAGRPEFKGTVAFVATAAFRRPAKESPNVGHGHHWFGNAESYFLIGNSMGEAMKRLIRK